MQSSYNILIFVYSLQKNQNIYKPLIAALWDNLAAERQNGQEYSQSDKVI